MFYSYEDDVRTKDPCRKRRQQIKILYSNTGGHVKTHLITQIQIYSGTYYVKRLNICRLSVRVRTHLHSYQVGFKSMLLPRYATVESRKARSGAAALTSNKYVGVRNQQLTACKYGYEY